MAIKIITSRSNVAFKLLQEITTSARARREHQASWIEGERLCEAYLRSAAPKAIAVIGRPGKLIADADDPKKMAALAASAGLSRYQDRIRETWVVDQRLFASISPVETSVGWGLLIPLSMAQGNAQNLPHADAATQAQAKSSDVVVLDRIQDPGNLGTILRSAAAAGVRHAWCTAGTTDPWSPKALRSAMGAHFVMRIAIHMSDQEVIDAAASQKINLLAAALAGDAASLYSDKLRLEKPCAWVFGNEANGVSSLLLARAQRVFIPQSEDIESLNVAAAASICLFEMRRRRA